MFKDRVKVARTRAVDLVWQGQVGLGEMSILDRELESRLWLLRQLLRLGLHLIVVIDNRVCRVLFFRLIMSIGIDTVDLDTQLQLGLGGSVKLFVTGRLFTVESEELSSTVRVPSQDNLSVRRDVEELADLEGVSLLVQQDSEDSAG